MMGPSIELNIGRPPHDPMSAEMIGELSEPSSPDSESFSELLDSASANDDVASQLAAAGPAGVAAAAAVLSCRKRKHPHRFETNPSRRKRQQTRLLRKLRHTIEEYTARVGQQAVVLCCTPGRNQFMQMYKVFGSQPLESVIRNNKQHVLCDLESALQEQTPQAQPDNPNLHELPPLIVDGIPTPVDKMTQAQLRNFIPEMLKYSTGRSKPGWGKAEFRPLWWPSDLPWANVRSDARTEEEKKRVPWTDALRQIVKNCYKQHGRDDLLQVFNEEPQSGSRLQGSGQCQYSGTLMQTINNPDGTLSIIQIDPGPNSIVTLSDGTQATVVQQVQETSQQNYTQNIQQPLTSLQQQSLSELTTQDISSQQIAVVSQNQDISMTTPSQQSAINSLQASLNTGGHILLTGADASQLAGLVQMMPMSVYQSVQGVQPLQTVQTIPNFTMPQNLNQTVQIAMAPVANSPMEMVNTSNDIKPIVPVGQNPGGVSLSDVPDTIHTVEVLADMKPTAIS